MRRINHIMTGMLVGILVGMWIGINIGKGRPPFTNPFEEKGIARDMKETGEGILKKGEELMKQGEENVEKAGKAMQDQVKD
jgi:hypothetical protein